MMLETKNMHLLWITMLLLFITDVCTTELDESTEDRLLSALHISHSQTRIKGHVTPPQYMLDLWHEVADEKGYMRAPTPYHSNTVRAVPDKAGTFQEQYYFNVSNVQAEEDILESELHLYKIKRPPVTHYHLWEIRIYQKTAAGLQDVLLDVKKISAYYHGWLVFNISSAVTRWRLQPSTNRGLRVKVLSKSSIQSDLAVFAQRGQHHDSKQPIIIVFSKDKSIEPDVETTTFTTVLYNRTKTRHQASPIRYGSDLGMNEDEDVSINASDETLERNRRQASNSRRGKRRKSRRLCQRRDFSVDVDKTAWKKTLIISPKVLQVNICVGNCRYPLTPEHNPTNHANILSIMHMLKKKKNIDLPCCVPTRLEKLTILHVQEDVDNQYVLLKQIPDMIATECGCRYNAERKVVYLPLNFLLHTIKFNGLYINS